MPVIKRAKRTRDEDPRSAPWELHGETDVVAVDTTWGEVQPLVAAQGVRTVGELELLSLVEAGAVLVDSRKAGSRWGCTLPGALSIPHDEMLARRAELDEAGVAILFCNGPQCPQSPEALQALVDDGFPATALAYYRGGLHDWVTMALPTTAASP